MIVAKKRAVGIASLTSEWYLLVPAEAVLGKAERTTIIFHSINPF